MTEIDLTRWAIRHHVGMDAIAELRAMLTTGATSDAGSDGSEARVASAVTFEAGRRGDIVLWRNNVGACKTDDGRMIRYGLANVSKAMNERIKSADLIGVYRRVITPDDVGRVIGQFLSVETKREGWKPSNSQRDTAQAAWASGVVAWGGVALIHASSSQPAFRALPQGAIA